MKKQEDIVKALLLAGDEKVTKVVPIKRLGIEFTIQAIDYDKLREQATFTTKKGKDVDTELLSLLVIESGCTIPNWNDPALVDKYGDAKSAIKRVLLSGERTKLGVEILDLSGFGDDEEELKN